MVLKLLGDSEFVEAQIGCFFCGDACIHRGGDILFSVGRRLSHTSSSTLPRYSSLPCCRSLSHTTPSQLQLRVCHAPACRAPAAIFSRKRPLSPPPPFSYFRFPSCRWTPVSPQVPARGEGRRRFRLLLGAGLPVLLLRAAREDRRGLEI